ncbi:hypothetical protein ABPG74_000809 [Tetrahymena malaccensis]
MIKYLILILTIKQFYAQLIQQCRNQKTFYDLSFQQCGKCQENCNSCDDLNNCIDCKQQYFYEQNTQQCVSQCKGDEFFKNYFQYCTECQVNNCNKCVPDGSMCQQCNKGWKLTNDQVYCQKSECLVNDFYNYNQDDGKCTTNCPDYLDLNQRLCINLKKFSTVNLAASKNNVEQVDINQIFYYQKLNGDQIIIALQNSNAVIFSFENLLPITQIKLFSQYIQAIQNKESIYLISDVVQKINLEEMSINIVFQQTQQTYEFSQQNYYSNTQYTFTIYNFQSQQQHNYTFQNILSVQFNYKYLNLIEPPANYDKSLKIPPNSVKDQLGCFIPNQTNDLVQIIKQDLNFVKREFLLENSQLYSQKINQYEQKFSAIEIVKKNITILSVEEQTTLIDLQNATNLIRIVGIVKNSILDAYEYDGKIRFIQLINNKSYKINQSAIICSNFTFDEVSQQYFFEYDQPHFLQSSKKIIEHQIFQNQSQIILASSIGYEIININTSLSLQLTDSSQNVKYLFDSSNNQVFNHLKFLSNSTALFYQISNNKIKICQLYFNSTSISLDLSQQLITLNYQEYTNFAVGLYQILNIDKQLVIAFNNQIQKIKYASQQQIYYSSFCEYNSAYYMKGIQKIISHNNKKLLIIIFKIGFRIIQNDDQKILFEKYLNQVIINSEVSNQYLGLVYQFQSVYNFVVFNIETYQMLQFNIDSTPVYINMVNQKNPSILFIAVYYENKILLFCIGSQKVDVFQINVTVYYNQISYSNTLQALNNTIYISTVEYYIITFNYNEQSSTLTQADSIYTMNDYINFDNNYIVVQAYCDVFQGLIYSRKQHQNTYKIYNSFLNETDLYFFINYVSKPELKLAFSNNQLGQIKIKVVDLDKKTSQSFSKSIFAQSDSSFILINNSQFKLVNTTNLQSTDLQFPFLLSVLQSQIIMINQQRYIIVKNIQNQNYLFNLETQQLEQILQFTDLEQNFLNLESNQIILYQSGKLVGNYLLSKSNQQIQVQIPPNTNIIDVDSSSNAFGVLIRSRDLNYYFDLFSNEVVRINLQKQSKLDFQKYQKIIGNKQILAQLKDGQYVICDEQLNILFQFIEQKYVTYSDYSFKLINYSITNEINKIDYEAVFKQQNSIVIKIYTQKEQIMYLYDYFQNNGNSIQLQDKTYYQKPYYEYKLIIYDDKLMIFLQPSASYFKIEKNGQYQLLKYLQYNGNQFSQFFKGSTMFYRKYEDLIIQFQPSKKQSILNTFDINLNQLKCQLTLTGSNSFIHSDLEGVIYNANQNYLSKINYLDCSMTSKSLYGIQFLDQSIQTIESFLFLEASLDMIVIISQNRSNIFQASTLTYQGSVDYQSYNLQTVAFYQQSTNIILTFFKENIFMMDLWTPLLSLLYQNSIKNPQNNLLYFESQNLAVYCDKNQGVLNTININNYQILAQFKLADSLSSSRYHIQLYSLTSETILAISSSSEFLIYDFVNNKLIKSVQNQVDCSFYSNIQQNVFCLDKGQIIKQFNPITLDFEAITENLNFQLQINKFNVLSQKIVSFIDIQGNFVLYNLIDKQFSPTLIPQKIQNKIEQIDQYILSLNSQTDLTVFKLDQNLNVNNIQKQIQFSYVDQQILDFIVVSFNNSNTLVFSSTLSIKIYNLQNNQIIGQLPTPSRLQSTLNQDQDYFDTTMFDINYRIKGNQHETQNVLLEIIQSSSDLENQNNNIENQYRVYSQGFQLIKYIVKMTIENSSLFQIKQIYEIFNSKTIIEYQFQTPKANIQQKKYVNLIDNQFILPQFQNLNFQSIPLLISSTQPILTLNPYNNMNKIIFIDIELVLFNNTSCLQIDNLNQLVFDQVIIQSTTLYRQSCSVKISNVTNLLIQNLTIQNMTILKDSRFLFSEINNITIINLNLINLQLIGNMFEFSDCQYIQIQNLNIQQAAINSGSLFSFLKSLSIQLTHLNFTMINESNQRLNNRNLKEQNEYRITQNKNQQDSILNFYGCQNVSIHNSEFTKFNDYSLIQTNHYSNNNIIQYFSYLLEMINCTVNQVNISSNKIAQIIIIQSVQVSFSNITLSNVISSNNLISWDVQQSGKISNSTFKQINLSEGSVIYMAQGQLSLLFSNFVQINSIGYPCALNVFQADQVLIENSNFKQLQNQNQQKQQRFNGGAIQAQNYQNITIQFSYFFKCSAFESGGAIYAFQGLQSSNFMIRNCYFLENISVQGSGGAIKFQKVYGISIVESKFENNSAFKQKGGSIYFEDCQLQQFNNLFFNLNKAHIGGSIYYTETYSDLLKQVNLNKNNVIFINNTAIFYGKNIGSVPLWIGISEYPDIKTLKIVDQFDIRDISSGNYLKSPLYLNFIDEEKNPLNFQSISSISDQNQFQLQLNSQNNSQIIIQQGNFARLNYQIGLFELNFQAVYSISQKQIIQIISNLFDSGFYLQVQLNLQFRNCIVGEIVQETKKFIQCLECPQGKYSLTLPDMDLKQNSIQLQCNLCPYQAYFCQGSQIKLSDGYWRENNLTDNIYKCNIQSCSFDNPKNINGCLEGYVGPICNSCDYTAQIWGKQYGLKSNQCLPCKDQLSQIIFFIVLLLGYFSYITYSMYSIRQTKIIIIKLYIFKKIDLLVTGILSSFSNDDLSILLKVYINYLQIISCILELGIEFPRFFNVTINILGDPVNTKIMSLDCLFKISEQYPIWLHRVVLQIFIMIILSILINLILCLIQYYEQKNIKKIIKNLPQIIRMTSVWIYIFYQPSFANRQPLPESIFQNMTQNMIHTIQNKDNDNKYCQINSLIE